MVRYIIKIILFQISPLPSMLTAFLIFLLGIGTALQYIIMRIHVFVVFDSFFMLHNTKETIEALIIRSLELSILEQSLNSLTYSC